MKVSVIIPVYNVKPYLERCVNSVLRQTYKDLEIILVDDGSTDGSGELCDDIATRDGRIRVIHQDNQGISGARNSGLHFSTGLYVSFLDADDAWLLDDGLEKLMEKTDTNIPDLIIFKCVHIWNDSRKCKTKNYNKKQIEKLSNTNQVFLYLVKTQQFNMSACFLLVRKKLLMDHDILFPDKIISEDVFWSLHLWQHAQSLEVQNLDFYGYFHREESITTTPSIKVYMSYDSIFSYWKSQCNADCPNAEAIRMYLANMWVNRGYGYFRLKNEEKPIAIQILQAHTDLLNFGKSPKAKRVRLMVKFFGVKFTVEILGCYWQLRNLITT